MQQWLFWSGDHVAAVEGADWLVALPDAMEALGIPRHLVPRVAVEHRSDGLLRLTAPGARVQLFAREFPDAVPLPEGALRGRQDVLVGERGTSGFSGRHSTVLETVCAHTLPAAPPGIAERLFERSRVIIEAESARQAAALALLLANQVVPAESASFLRGGIQQSELEIFAATGPHRIQALGKRIAFGTGVCGNVHDTGIAVLIDDLQLSARHLHAVDEATGYHPRSLIAVPVSDGRGYAWGVLELLHSDPNAFQEWHAEAAGEVALFLADSLTRLLATEEIFPELVPA